MGSEDIEFPRTVPQFLEMVEKRYTGGLHYHFRGQARNRQAWPLLPKAGRSDYFGPGFASNEQSDPLKRFSGPRFPQEWRKVERLGYSSPIDMRVFSEWCNQASCLGNLPEDEWERLALAQHHGLATRLLDLTTNPLVALFFACAAEPQEDGAVYGIPGVGIVTHEKFEELGHMMIYIPRPFDRRIAAQQSLFAYFADPIVPLRLASEVGESSTAEMWEIPIPSENKYGFIRELGRLGVSRASLFPDLEGLSWDLNYTHQVERQIFVKFRRGGKPPPEVEGGQTPKPE